MSGIIIFFYCRLPPGDRQLPDGNDREYIHTYYFLRAVLRFAGIAQSVRLLFKECMVRGSNPIGARISATVQICPGAPPNTQYNGCRAIPQLMRPERDVNNPHPAPMLKKE